MEANSLNSLLSQIASFAQAAAPAAGAPRQPNQSFLGSFWIFIPLFGIMYFLMIRPQQKKQRETQEMLKKLQAGNKVMTTAGALGRLVKVNEKTVVIEFGPGNQVEYLRAAVAEIIPEETGAAADAAKK